VHGNSLLFEELAAIKEENEDDEAGRVNDCTPNLPRIVKASSSTEVTALVYRLALLCLP